MKRRHASPAPLLIWRRAHARATCSISCLIPQGCGPSSNWEIVAAGLLQRVHRESVGHIVDQKTVELLKKLEKYPGVKSLSAIPRTHSPVLPITFVKGSERFSYFSLITTVGTPQSITAQELRIECMFPIEPGSK